MSDNTALTVHDATDNLLRKLGLTSDIREPRFDRAAVS